MVAKDLYGSFAKHQYTRIVLAVQTSKRIGLLDNGQ